MSISILNLEMQTNFQISYVFIVSQTWSQAFSFRHSGFPVQPSLSHFYADDVKSINFGVNTKHDVLDLQINE